jgi:hypothetical protein
MIMGNPSARLRCTTALALFCSRAGVVLVWALASGIYLARRLLKTGETNQYDIDTGVFMPRLRFWLHETSGAGTEIAGTRQAFLGKMEMGARDWMQM